MDLVFSLAGAPAKPARGTQATHRFSQSGRATYLWNHNL